MPMKEKLILFFFLFLIMVSFSGRFGDAVMVTGG